MRIGVLALQGAFVDHIAMLSQLEVEAILIHLPQELNQIDGLILPGGESTAIAKLLSDYQLSEPIRERAREGFPILGTCAGMILLAKGVFETSLEPLGLMDIEVRRNAFGRQVDSFEADLAIPALGEEPFPGIFIRAPLLEKADPEVEVLCNLPDGRGVAVREGKLLACAFHPELTSDLRFHRYFLDIVRDATAKSNNR